MTATAPPTGGPDGMLTHEEVVERFTYHRPKEGQPVLYEDIRERARSFAHYLNLNVPAGRELALALTKLEECVMHANSGIARHG